MQQRMVQDAALFLLRTPDSLEDALKLLSHAVARTIP
jgi:hypothetical protein